MYSTIYVYLLINSFQINGLHLSRTTRLWGRDLFQGSLGICCTNMFLPALEENLYSILEFLRILTIFDVSHSNDDNTSDSPNFLCNNLSNIIELPGHSDAKVPFLPIADSSYCSWGLGLRL